MLSLSIEAIGYAFIGGLLPALIWLDFLLKEEGRCPEPRWIVAAAFVLGMIAVPLVIPFEQIARALLPACIPADQSSCMPLVIAWATIEETLKYALAAIFLLWRQIVKEWVHVVTTMITVALGFAALENILFLLEPFANGNIVHGFITGNLRFVGSTLLHVLASSAIGFALAFSYRANRPLRTLSAAIGLILAIILHAVFNILIMSEGGSDSLLAFFTVWVGALIFFATFEVLKYFKYRDLPKNVC